MARRNKYELKQTMGRTKVNKQKQNRGRKQTIQVESEINKQHG